MSIYSFSNSLEDTKLYMLETTFNGKEPDIQPYPTSNNVFEILKNELGTSEPMMYFMQGTCDKSTIVKKAAVFMYANIINGKNMKNAAVRAKYTRNGVVVDAYYIFRTGCLIIESPRGSMYSVILTPEMLDVALDMVKALM
jgi:hypothetical protein